MYLVHQTSRSEWDEAYTNFRVTSNEANFAIAVAGLVALLMLFF